MNLIQKQPNPDGSYRQIYQYDCVIPPDGCYQVAHGVELSHGGFGTLTVEDGIVTAFTPDVEAWEQWQSEHPEPVAQMTTQEAILDKLTEIEYRQDLMELGLTEGGI